MFNDKNIAIFLAVITITLTLVPTTDIHGIHDKIWISDHHCFNNCAHSTSRLGGFESVKGVSGHLWVLKKKLHCISREAIY